MPNMTVRAAAIGLPSRQDLERLIEDAIAALDLLDGDPDLEPSLGYFDARYQPDAEDDPADREPSLASTHDINQENWSQGAMDDTEADELGPMARATYSVMGEAQATRETSARLGVIIARLSGFPAGSRADIDGAPMKRDGAKGRHHLRTFWRGGVPPSGAHGGNLSLLCAL